MIVVRKPRLEIHRGGFSIGRGANNSHVPGGGVVIVCLLKGCVGHTGCGLFLLRGTVDVLIVSDPIAGTTRDTITVRGDLREQVAETIGRY